MCAIHFYMHACRGQKSAQVLYLMSPHLIFWEFLTALHLTCWSRLSGDPLSVSMLLELGVCISMFGLLSGCTCPHTFLTRTLVCKTISSGCPWRIPKQHAGALLRETRDAKWESLTPAWLAWSTEILSIWQWMDSHSGYFHSLLCGPQMLRKHRHWSLPYLPRHKDCYLYLINLFDWSEVTSWSQSFIEPWSSIFVYIDQSFCDILNIFKQKEQNANSVYRIHW